MTKTMLGTNKLFFFITVFLFACQNQTAKLPYLGNPDVEYREKDGKMYADTIYPKIPDFIFLNQDSTAVSLKNYKNKIWIAEFFFTTCPTICPIMNSQMKRIYEAVDLNHELDEFQFLSFSINPNTDKPSILKKYAKDHHINLKNWDFLTGDEAATHRLGIQNFLTFAGKDDEAQGGYAHSGSFSLVDKAGYVRGVYAITNFDLTVNEQEFDRLVNDIKSLLNEHSES